MIDRVTLQTKIRQYADNLIIDQIGETEIALFVSKSKDIVEYAFEEYINEQYEMFHSRVKPGKQPDFSSFTDGYVAQMKRWVESNGINLNPVELTDPKDVLDEQPSSHKYNTHIKIAIGGTAIAAGIMLLPKVITLPACIAAFSPFAAIAIEIIALGLAYRAYKKSKSEEDSVLSNSNSAKDFSDNLNVLKDRLISGIWSQLDTWLDNADKESENILNFYINE